MVGTKIYIGNLHANVLKTDLEREFGKIGRTREVYISRNPPGYGFVDYYTNSDAERAIRTMHGTAIWGTKLIVEMSKHPIPKSKLKRPRSELRSGAYYSSALPSYHSRSPKKESRNLIRRSPIRSSFTETYKKNRGSHDRSLSPPPQRKPIEDRTSKSPDRKKSPLPKSISVKTKLAKKLKQKATSTALKKKLKRSAVSKLSDESKYTRTSLSKKPIKRLMDIQVKPVFRSSLSSASPKKKTRKASPPRLSRSRLPPRSRSPHSERRYSPAPVSHSRSPPPLMDVRPSRSLSSSVYSRGPESGHTSWVPYPEDLMTSGDYYREEVPKVSYSRRYSRSPPRRGRSPLPRNGSPIPRRLSPWRRTPPPGALVSPPRGRSPPMRGRSPARRGRAPPGRDIPGIRSRSPYTRGRSPLRRPISPRPRGHSPYGLDRSPLPRGRSPVRQYSPAHMPWPLPPPEYLTEYWERGTMPPLPPFPPGPPESWKYRKADERSPYSYKSDERPPPGYRPELPPEAYDDRYIRAVRGRRSRTPSRSPTRPAYAKSWDDRSLPNDDYSFENRLKKPVYADDARPRSPVYESNASLKVRKQRRSISPWSNSDARKNRSISKSFSRSPTPKKHRRHRSLTPSPPTRMRKSLTPESPPQNWKRVNRYSASRSPSPGPRRRNFSPRSELSSSSSSGSSRSPSPPRKTKRVRKPSSSSESSYSSSSGPPSPSPPAKQKIIRRRRSSVSPSPPKKVKRSLSPKVKIKRVKNTNRKGTTMKKSESRRKSLSSPQSNRQSRSSYSPPARNSKYSPPSPVRRKSSNQDISNRGNSRSWSPPPQAPPASRMRNRSRGYSWSSHSSDEGHSAGRSSHVESRSMKPKLARGSRSTDSVLKRLPVGRGSKIDLCSTSSGMRIMYKKQASPKIIRRSRKD